MIRNVLGFFVAFFASAQLALATPILTQTPAMSIVYQSDADTSSILADDFSLASGDFVRTVSWRGVYMLRTTLSAPDVIPPADAFTLQFYGADNLGAVGSLLRTFSVGDNVNRTDTGLKASLGAQRTVFDYTVDLGENLALGTGIFWLSIFNNTTAHADFNWWWAGNEPFLGGSYTSAGSPDLGQNFYPARVTTYLVLDGGNTPVPEPASLALLALGLAGLAFSRYKKA